MRLTFWQPFASFHQEAFLNALARAEGVERVTLCVEGDLPDSRRRAGWREANMAGVFVRRIQPDDVPEDGEDVVHVFTGFGTHRNIWKVFARLPRHRRCRVWAYTEAPDVTGVMGRLRSWKYGITAKVLAPRLDGILATGGCCAEFYRGIVPSSCPVKEFGYFDGTAEPAAGGEDILQGVARLLVVGQLIPRKGVDRLMKALAPFSYLSWRLCIVGEGPAKGTLRLLAQKYRIENRLQWMGTVRGEELRELYRKSSCLILPSRWDGWGMTVNEALREGCPVRVTETCGAASLLPEAWRLAEDERRWAKSLLSVLSNKSAEADRKLARSLSRKTLGEEGARRFLEAIADTSAA
jgi:glycosyltransferase involved in cell wall biosynthesis